MPNRFRLREKRYTIWDGITITFMSSPFLVLMKAVFVVISSLRPVITVYGTARMINAAVAYAQGEDASALTVPLLILFAIVVFDKLENAVTQITNVHQRLKLYENVRLAITERRNRLAYTHVEKGETYDLIKRVSNNPAEQIAGTFEALAWLIGMVSNVACLLVMLFTSVGWLALIVIAAAVPAQYIAMKNGRTLYAGFKESEKITRKADYISDILNQRGAVDERTLFGFSTKMNERFLSMHAQIYGILEKIHRDISLRRLVADLLILLVSLGITAELAYAAYTGRIDVATCVALTGTVFSVVQYTSGRIPWLIHGLTRNVEYFRDLTAFAALDTVEGADSLPSRPIPAFHAIAFRNVTFRYPGGGYDILRGLTLELTAGKHYALVGANGAGKSTLIKLLLGLYTDYEGEIQINGQSLRDIPLAAQKAYFAVVHQDFARYAVSLHDNIALGAGLDLEQQQPDISRAAALMDIETLAQELPEGMDAVIGKEVTGGHDLSGGQWQRVAMARALASEAPVVILDEPTAALDPITESNVYQRFGEISRDRTTLFISHRLGSTKLADEIIVIDGGRVAEQGSHEALMARNGLYAVMYETQRSWYQ